MLVWRQIGKAFVFQRNVQDMAYDCGFFYTVQKTLREAYTESPASASRISVPSIFIPALPSASRRRRGVTNGLQP